MSQCLGLTELWKRCKYNAPKGKRYCGRHKYQEALNRENRINRESI